MFYSFSLIKTTSLSISSYRTTISRSTYFLKQLPYIVSRFSFPLCKTSIRGINLESNKNPKKERKMKYVLVTGGVVSGLGKGVTASSIGVVLKSCGLRVTSIKIGMISIFLLVVLN